MGMDVEEILKEREFLHDISNQLLIAQGMGSFVLDQIQEREPEDSKERIRMEKAMKAVDKIVKMLISRREYIKSLPSN